jgi:DNA-binding transcriptional LysR family regulator
MTIRHMRIFIQVYETQNVTKAAELLHMTQPAVSRAIQEIEHYYGVQLFERIRHRLTVTQAGKQLYQQALHIVDSFDVLEKGMHNWDSFGVLRIGASITIGNYMLPRFIVRFKERYPHVRIQCMVLNSDALQAALMENRLDMALIEGPIRQPELCTKEFAQDEMLLVTAPGHPLLKKDKVTLADVSQYDLLMREEGSAGRTFVESVFAANGMVLHPAMVSISTQAIIRMVRCGLGISILPRQLVAEDIAAKNLCTKPIENVEMKRNYNMAWHCNKFLSPSLRAFLDICGQETGSSLCKT